MRNKAMIDTDCDVSRLFLPFAKFVTIMCDIRLARLSINMNIL